MNSKIDAEAPSQDEVAVQVGDKATDEEANPSQASEQKGTGSGLAFCLYSLTPR